MSEEARPRVKATLELGEERCDVEVGASSPDGRLLSEKLVELKALCMQRLGLFLARDNVSVGEDTLLQDSLEDPSDDEDDDNEDLLDATDDHPPCPKKRK